MRTAAVVLGLSVPAHAEPGARYKTDADDVLWMKSAHPRAWEKVDAGEKLLREATSPADVEKAADLFRQATGEAIESVLAPRRECQALAALGKHDAAIAACSIAIKRGGKVLDLRAMVGALMSGPYLPNGSEAGRALFYARRAIEIMPEAPWGYAAECDIAAKLGDTPMLETCSAALARVAPGHYETERATAIAASIRPGFRVVAGWFLVGVAVLGTLARALRRAWRKTTGAKSAAAIGALALAVLAASPARADEPSAASAAPWRGLAMAGHLSRYPISEADPESSVPTPAERDKDPLEYGYFLMDLGDAADKAIARADHVAAARFSRAIAKAVPDSAEGFRRACGQYEAAGDLIKAKGFCAAALTMNDSLLGDYSHYARVVFAGQGLLPADVANLDSVVEHLKKEDVSRTVGWDIECNLGVRLADTKRLRDCTVPWAALTPNDSKVIFYSWVLALHENDYSGAQRLVARAKSASSPPDQVRRMEQATFDAMPLWRKGFRDWRFGVIAAIAAIAAIAVLLSLLTRRRSATHVSA